MRGAAKYPIATSINSYACIDIHGISYILSIIIIRWRKEECSEISHCIWCENILDSCESFCPFNARYFENIMG
jgi:hypothetical protein